MVVRAKWSRGTRRLGNAAVAPTTPCLTKQAPRPIHHHHRDSIVNANAPLGAISRIWQSTSRCHGAFTTIRIAVTQPSLKLGDSPLRRDRLYGLARAIANGEIILALARAGVDSLVGIKGFLLSGPSRCVMAALSHPPSPPPRRRLRHRKNGQSNLICPVVPRQRRRSAHLPACWPINRFRHLGASYVRKDVLV